MKRIVASVGLAALSATAIQSAVAQSLDVPRPSKPFDIAATVRGFYDDNPSTQSNDSPSKQDSFGFEVSPTLSYALSLETTTISLSYLYSLKYYEQEPVGNDGHYDQTHTFNAALDHSFSENYRASLKESFVIGQEPDLLRAGNSVSTPFRVPGDNIRNYAGISLDGVVAPKIGFGVGYDNAYYDYADDSQTFTAGGVVVGSLGGTLNRLEHGVHLDGKWLATPATTGVLGFRFRETDYTADQLIAGNINIPTTLVNSSERDSRLYSPNVGLDHQFAPDLTGSVRVGASYADYFNSPTSEGGWSPFASISMRYLYNPDSSFELGFEHDRNSTDVIGFQTVGPVTRFTLDSETSTVFGSINHTFSPRIIGSLTGQYQRSTFNSGSLNDESENYFMAGINVEYRFSQNVSAHVGYNYDQLSSDQTLREYDRNRVYLGVTASY